MSNITNASSVPECVVSFIYSSGDECNVFRLQPDMIGTFEYEVDDHVVCVHYDSNNKKLSANIKLPLMNLSPFEVLWTFVSPTGDFSSISQCIQYEYDFDFNEREKVHKISSDNPQNIDLFLGIYLGERGAQPLSARLYENESQKNLNKTVIPVEQDP